MSRGRKPCSRVWKGIVIAVLLFALPLLGVESVQAISIQEEAVMGQKFLEAIRRQFEFLEDDFAEDYLNDLGQYLLNALETRPFPFHFYLIRDNDLNAFAGPGGHVFFFSGLIVGMDTADELAAVLCHEISHVSARHLSERMDQAKKIGLASLAGVLAGVLVGGKAGAAIMSGTMAAGIQKQLSYSREDERQSDQMGFRYMVDSGFDPSAMVTTFTNLEKGHWYGADGIPTYLSTHPGGPERIANMEAMLSGLKAREDRPQIKRFRDLFPFFKAVVASKSLDPHDLEAQLRKVLDKDPSSSLAHFSMGIMWQERTEYDKAIQHFREALKSYPDSLPILRKLAASYQFKGMDVEAIRILERAHRAEGQDKSTMFLLARSYQNVEEHAKAIGLYERLALMKPVRDDVYYNLGVCYGRENRLAQAHYNFGVFFKRTGALNKAKFHFQKAQGLAGGNPVLQGKIRESMEGIKP